MPLIFALVWMMVLLLVEASPDEEPCQIISGFMIAAFVLLRWRP